MTVEAEHVYVDAINFQIKESFDLKTFQAKLQSTQFVSKKKHDVQLVFIRNEFSHAFTYI